MRQIQNDVIYSLSLFLILSIGNLLHCQESQFDLKIDSLIAENNYNEVKDILIKELYVDQNYPQSETKYLIELVKAYNSLSDFSNAKITYERIKLNLSDTVSPLSASAFLNKSHFELRIGNIDTSILFLNKAINVYSSLKDTTMLIRSFINLSTMENKRGGEKKAFKLLEKAKRFSIESKQPLSGYFYNNMARYYRNLGKLDSSIIYGLKSIEVAKSKETPDAKIIAISYFNVAGYHKSPSLIKKKIEMLDSCRNYFHNQIPQDLKTLIYDGLMQSYTSIGEMDSVKKFMVLKQQLIDENFEDEISKGTEEVNYTIGLEKEEIIKEKKNALKFARLTRNVILTLGGLLFGIFLLKIKQVRQDKVKEVSLNNVLKKEQKLLKLKLSSNFIFREIDNIVQFIEEGKNKIAADYLSTFSKTIRLNLENSREIIRPLDEEIEAINQYFKLKMLNPNFNFELKTNISNEIDSANIFVPSMILEPFVENLQEIGKQNSNTNFKYEINFVEEENNIVCLIIDQKHGDKYVLEKSELSISDEMEAAIQRLENITEVFDRKKNISIGESMSNDDFKYLLKIPILNNQGLK